MKLIMENWRRFLNEQNDQIEAEKLAETVAAEYFDKNFIEAAYYWVNQYAPDNIQYSPLLDSINWVKAIPDSVRLGELKPDALYKAKVYDMSIEIAEEVGESSGNPKFSFFIEKSLQRTPGLADLVAPYKEGYGQIFVPTESYKRKVIVETQKIYQEIIEAQQKGITPAQLNKRMLDIDDEVPRPTQYLKKIAKFATYIRAIEAASIVVHEIIHKQDFESGPAAKLLKYYHDNLKSSYEKLAADLNSIGPDALSDFTDEVEDDTGLFDNDEIDLSVFEEQARQKTKQIAAALRYQAEEFAYDQQIAFLERVRTKHNFVKLLGHYNPIKMIDAYILNYRAGLKKQLDAVRKQQKG